MYMPSHFDPYFIYSTKRRKYRKSELWKWVEGACRFVLIVEVLLYSRFVGTGFVCFYVIVIYGSVLHLYFSFITMGVWRSSDSICSNPQRNQDAFLAQSPIGS